MTHTGQAPALLAAQTQSFLSPTGIEFAFLLVGLVTLGAAVMTVTTRQLVHAALWLVVALGGLAVEYLLLTAEFIAWVQVLIYVGSVVVLLLFGLMLTKAPIGRSPDTDSGNRPVALAVAVTAAVALVWVVVDAFRTTWIDLDGPAQGSTATMGETLFRHWVLPFEALSVLLLAALVGAIVLSRKRSGPGGDGDDDPVSPAPPAPRSGTARRARADRTRTAAVTPARATAQTPPAAPATPAAAAPAPAAPGAAARTTAPAPAAPDSPAPVAPDTGATTGPGDATAPAAGTPDPAPAPAPEGKR
jgi:NADH-quinone oxidoreductase subunit J